MPTAKIILASASPRRKELLELLGFEFAIIAADIDETRKEQETPQALVARLAAEKAQKVAQPQSWVLGADTVVVVDNKILGKPAAKHEAVSMLQALSGRTHAVHTGFAVIKEDLRVVQCVSSLVTFRPLGAAEIDNYTSGAEPYDKAGGYALQGAGAAFISAISGSYTGVIGLPLSEVVATLLALGAIQFSG
ncbi:MAG: Maf family protein [Deltaproteobacteria bacterium]|nr:Maf family protein [Deltaproteobacteria bacterium]